jgi:hypothetical protein
MSTAICPVCDRHFQTTAGASNTYGPVSSAQTAHWAQGSPYAYGNYSTDFQVKRPNAYTSHDSPKVEYAPILVSVLFLPWLGMILNHQVSKGLVTLAVIALTCAAYLLSPHGSPLILLTLVLIGLAYYVIGLLDVIAIAQRLARSEEVREWDWF